jgi:hypothetical protein
MIEKEPEIIEVWDKKRIGMFFLVVILIGAAGIKILNLDTKLKPYFIRTPRPTTDVAGAKTDNSDSGFVFKDDKPQENSSPVDTIKTTITDKINTLKDQVNNLNVQEIASSSPQVQKIINDLKNLQDAPKNQVKEVCQKICGGF